MSTSRVWVACLLAREVSFRLWSLHFFLCGLQWERKSTAAAAAAAAMIFSNELTTHFDWQGKIYPSVA